MDYIVVHHNWINKKATADYAYEHNWHNNKKSSLFQYLCTLFSSKKPESHPIFVFLGLTNRNRSRIL